MIILMNLLNRLSTYFQTTIQSLRNKTCSLPCYCPHSMGIWFSRFKIVSLVKYMQQSEGNVSVFLLSQVGHAIISQNFITTLLKAELFCTSIVVAIFIDSLTPPLNKRVYIHHWHKTFSSAGSVA